MGQAQEIIDKHGPAEEEEKEAVSEPAQITPLPGQNGETVDFDDRDDSTSTAAATPSGYNSDSSESCSSSDENAALEGSTGKKRKPHQKSESLRDPKESADKVVKACTTGAKHSADGDDNDGGEGEVDGVTKMANKKRRKERVALTGESKAEVKAELATVAFERALRVAEVLA